MNWNATRGPEAAERDDKPIGSLVFPWGRETYFVEGGELRRRFARHPGVQAHQRGLWVWL
jgi:hypothetical protein